MTFCLRLVDGQQQHIVLLSCHSCLIHRGTETEMVVISVEVDFDLKTDFDMLVKRFQKYFCTVEIETASK